MFIAVTALGENLDAEIDPRFGRAARFVLVDSESMAFRVVENQRSLNVPQGAGIQAAQTLANQGAEVLLTGNCGPKAFLILQAAGIKVVVGVKGRVRDVVLNYLNGEYQHAVTANVEGHWA